ncbi:MAG: 50S ribosomal protein L22 [candidate division TM6 bacterium GW2011_GWF2_32_72]|nr:MAG: 50S ribosomal protein L22 [candidate division TM6 bacterium GW2011_GWF2_32_72]
MQFTAKVKNVRFSPYKLRPLADVVRGKNATYALNWLKTYPVKRVIPMEKMLESAVANAKFLNSVEIENLLVKEIRVDQGPIFKYFKAGSRGRPRIQRKRLSHMSIILETKEV